MSTGSGVHVLCAMNTGPVWEARVLNLVRSLRWFGGELSDAPFTAIGVGSVGSGFLQRLEAMGGAFEVSAPAIDGHPFMNKTRALDEDRGADLVVLDCDVVVVGDLGDLRGTDVEVRAKPADADPFSFEDWLCFEHSFGPVGYGSLRTTTTAQITGCYVNSGVLFVGQAIRDALRSTWLSTFPRAVAAVTGRLPRKAFYAEQLALGAAICATGAPLSLIDATLNWPAHLEACTPDDGPPRLIHYHSSCQDRRVVAPLAPAAVQEKLERLAAASDGALVAPEVAYDASVTAIRRRSEALRLPVRTEGRAGRT